LIVQNGEGGHCCFGRQQWCLRSGITAHGWYPLPRLPFEDRPTPPAPASLPTATRRPSRHQVRAPPSTPPHSQRRHKVHLPHMPAVPPRLPVPIRAAEAQGPHAMDAVAPLRPPPTPIRAHHGHMEAPRTPHSAIYRRPPRSRPPHKRPPPPAPRPLPPPLTHAPCTPQPPPPRPHQWPRDAHRRRRCTPLRRPDRRRGHTPPAARCRGH